MKVTCPKCNDDISANDINIAQGILFCRHCNEMFSLENIDIENTVDANFDIKNPPSGAWHENTLEGETIGASCRSLGSFVFCLIFVFGFGAIPIIIFLGGFGDNENENGLFLIPFVLVGFGMLIPCVLSLAGKTEVSLNTGICSAYTGVLFLRSNKNFFAQEIENIKLVTCGQKNNTPWYRIELTKSDGSTIKLGMMLNDVRLNYVCNALKLRIPEYRK